MRSAAVGPSYRGARPPLIGKIEAQLNPNEIVLIQLPTRDLALAKVTMLDMRYAYVDTEGNIVDEWFLNERWEEGRAVRPAPSARARQHGLAIVGFVALTMLLLLIAGAIALWPMRRGFRNGFRILGVARRHLLTAHRNTSIEALPFGLTLATGVVLAFPTQVEELFLDPVRTSQEYSDALSLGVDEIFRRRLGRLAARHAQRPRNVSGGRGPFRQINRSDKGVVMRTASSLPSTNGSCSPLPALLIGMSIAMPRSRSRARRTSEWRFTWHQPQRDAACLANRRPSEEVR